MSAKKLTRAPKPLEIPDLPVLDHINDRENSQILASLKSIVENENKNDSESIKSDFELTRSPNDFNLDYSQPKEESKQDLVSSSKPPSFFTMPDLDESMESTTKPQFNSEEIADLQDLSQNFSELITQFVNDRKWINLEGDYPIVREESKEERMDEAESEPQRLDFSSKFDETKKYIRIKKKKLFGYYVKGSISSRNTKKQNKNRLENNYQTALENKPRLHHDLVLKIKALERLLPSFKM